jgi:hypothetical protein
LDIEAKLGVSILNGELDIGRLSAKALRTVLFVALCHSGAKYAPEEIGKTLGLRGLAEARHAIIDAWIACMPEKSDEETNGDGKPRTWLDVWADNRQYLGITDEQWLSMTPRMVQALDKRRRENTRRWELMISRVCATVANFAGKQAKKPLPDDTWMIDPWKRKDMTPDSPDYWDRLFGLDAKTVELLKKGGKAVVQ